jgi:hypothetical protein
MSNAKIIISLVALIVGNVIVFADEEEGFLCLSEMFNLGFAVLDGNNDGLADVVNTKVIIPPAGRATPFHAAAAAEIAARLGFETTALSFPIVASTTNVKRNSEIYIRVALLEEVREELKAEIPDLIPFLKPGYGAVLSISPKSSLMCDVLIVGADGPGLQFAAASFAGRWPNAWEIWGEKTSTFMKTIRQQASDLLVSAGIKPDDIVLRGMVYQVDKEQDKNPDTISEEKRRNLENMRFDTGEVKAAIISITTDSLEAGKRAIAAVEELRKAHLRGEKINILNYPGIAKTVLIIEAPGESLKVEISRFGYPARMLQRSPDPALMKKPEPVKGEDINLSNLYSLEGLYTDSMKDQIPDRVETTLVLGRDAVVPEIGDFAARLSLECAGAGFPLTAIDPRVDQLEKIKQPILIGEGEGTAHLRKLGKLAVPDLKPNQGYICVVRKAFNESNAVVILGDSAGLSNAMRYLAVDYPGITSSLPGEVDLKKVQQEAESLLKVTNIAGQIIEAAAAVSGELPTLKRRSLSKLKVQIALDKSAPAYERVFTDWLKQHLGEVDIQIEFVGRRDPKPVIEEKKEFQWEVDELKETVEKELLPKINKNDVVDLDVRLSEPIEILKETKEWLLTRLEEKGVGKTNVRIICAYKQGFHWLRDEVLPKLEKGETASVLIKFGPEEPDFEEIRKFYPEPGRWLSELYPIDEIYAEILEIPLEKIVFELDSNQKTTYLVEAFDGDNKKILSEQFTPKTIMRPYLKKYPEWASVASSTGWLSAKVNDVTVIDKRISTDPERIWDYYQDNILNAAYEHVMETTEKKPTLEKQPFFHTLQVEAWLSEPDERLGLDEEIVSSIESLHEDIYFVTLDFFNGMVPRKQEELPEEAMYLTRIGAPGSVIPLIHPSRPGQAPEAAFTFLGNHAPEAGVEISWVSDGDKEDSKKIPLKTTKPKAVNITALIVDETGLESCEISAALEKADRIGRLAEGLPLLASVWDKALKEFWFSKPGLGKTYFRLEADGADKVLELPSTAAMAAQNETAEKTDIGDIPLDEIIDPEEAAKLCLELGNNPGVRAYQSGASYQGIAVYSLELTAPTASTHLSQAKMVTYKPTILITGRQHANEVSSTTHILRLAELLVEDPRFQVYRNRLNIILHPMENPDGALLAEKLIELNKFHMNHAARYTALGTDLGTQFNNPETLLTEALVRPALWNRWLPDIYLNCHGYPSHEWVQQFSGYSPYQFRDYWIPRGWFVYVTHLDDPRSPEHRGAAQALLKYIDGYLSSDPKILETNERIYDRFWRWSGRWQPHVVNYEKHGRTMIYFDRRTGTPAKPSPRNEITALEGIPEQMDETAQGTWMETVVSQGLFYLEAHLNLLSDAATRVEKLEEETGGRVFRTVFRKRPIVPEDENE